MSAVEFEKTILAELLETLQKLPGLFVKNSQYESWPIPSCRVDAEIDLDAAGRSITLIVEIKSRSIYPRDVRDILWRLRDMGLFSKWGKLHVKEVPFLVAESISPGARELLRNENVGYFDKGGTVYIPAQGAFYFHDKPVPKSAEKTAKALFSAKRSQVSHALLRASFDWFNVKTIAELAEVSNATASEALSAFERYEWLDKRGSGPTKERRLKEPSSLLNAWAKASKAKASPTYRRFYVPMKKPEEIASQISEICERLDARFVATGEIAGQRYAPFLSHISQCKCKLSSGTVLDQIVGELDARPVNEGANLLVAEVRSSSHFLFKEKIEGVWCASPVLIYLELIHGSGRSADLAEHLRREQMRI